MQAKRAPSWWRRRLAIADVATGKRGNLQLQLTTKKKEKTEPQPQKQTVQITIFAVACLRGAEIENQRKS